jgi:uncharacterized protein (DUF58 family)
MAIDSKKYLDPNFLAKVGSLDLRARLLVEGYVAGMHRSPYHGFSVEFAQHRPYAPGDEIKHLDWKVLARTDKCYLKQYEEETNLVCMLLVDASASMAYPPKEESGNGSRMSKYEYGVLISAALGYLALHQRDAVGLTVFDEGVRKFLRPSNNPAQWRNVVAELENGVGPGKTDFQAVCDGLAERLKKRTLLVLVSDLLMDLDSIRRGLQHLRHRRHEIMVLQVLDTDEISFPFRTASQFEGMEEESRIRVDPVRLRKRYIEEVSRFTSRVRRICRELTIDFVQLNTAGRLDVALTAFLAERSAAIK